MAKFVPITEEQAKDPKFQSGGSSMLGATYSWYTTYLGKGWFEYKGYSGTIPRYEIPKLQAKIEQALIAWRSKTGGQTKVSKIIQRSTGKRSSVAYNTGTSRRPSHDAGVIYDLFVRYQLLLPVEEKLTSSVSLGAPPPAHNEQKVNELYNKMVKFMKEWDSYSKLDKQTLKQLYQQTSRIDFGEMRDSDKGSLIAGIMESKYGRNGFPSDNAKRLEALTGESADSWQKKAAREARGRPLLPPKPIPTKPTAVEPTGKAPSSGPRRFQNQNRLGWDKGGFSAFYNLTKPGSIWTNVQKNYSVNSEYSKVAENIQMLINLFSNPGSKYQPLVDLFKRFQEYHNLARNPSSLTGDVPMAASYVSQMKSLIPRIQERFNRLYDFSRREALAKSIVMKSLNSRKMI